MNHHSKKPKNPITFGVTYGAHGNSFTTTFTDPQSDGVSAEQKARDYYDAAVNSPESVMAWCEITRDGEPWMSSRFPFSSSPGSLSNENKDTFFRLMCECRLLRLAHKLVESAEKKLKKEQENSAEP